MGHGREAGEREELPVSQLTIVFLDRNRLMVLHSLLNVREFILNSCLSATIPSALGLQAVKAAAIITTDAGSKKRLGN
jgi:hypothetical protein